MRETKSREEVSATTVEVLTEEIQNRLSKTMIFLCYLLALIFVAFILYSLTTVSQGILSNFNFFDEIGRWEILSHVGGVYLIIVFTRTLGNFWRSNSKNDIGTGITNFPNPFYDSSYVKGPLLLTQKYNNLVDEYKKIQEILGNTKKAIEEHENINKSFETKLRVLIRHNNNINRILKSYNYLIESNSSNLSTKMLQDILSECITVLERDQSDKSISLFKVMDDQLCIVHSNRINAESVAKRVFNKGMGFAGYIWEKEETEIVNNIIPTDSRFHDQGIPATPIGSIIGVPLKVNEKIIGVLCLQSENEDGFVEADLRTVEFYASMCTHIILCDKIYYNKGVGEHADASRKN